MYFDLQYFKNFHCIAMLIVSFSTSAWGLHTALNPPMNCAHANATWDVSQSTLYNQAFAWTHRQEINDWSYAPASVDVAELFDDCVQVRYGTRVKVPRFFFAYNKQDDQKVQVDKLVCVKTTKRNKALNTEMVSALEEKITLHNVPFVHSIDIVISGKLQNNKVTLDANIDISIPWYLQILRLEIDNHVTHSLDEYLRLLVHDVCGTKQRKLAKLAKPPHIHLHVQRTRRQFVQYA